MSILDSNQFNGTGRLPIWLRETLFAAVILAIILPAFRVVMTHYTDGILRQASDPEFQDSIRRLVKPPPSHS